MNSAHSQKVAWSPECRLHFLRWYDLNFVGLTSVILKYCMYTFHPTSSRYNIYLLLSLTSFGNVRCQRSRYGRITSQNKPQNKMNSLQRITVNKTFSHPARSHIEIYEQTSVCWRILNVNFSITWGWGSEAEANLLLDCCGLAGTVHWPFCNSLQSKMSNSSSEGGRPVSGSLNTTRHLQISNLWREGWLCNYILILSSTRVQLYLLCRCA